jgi:hypothetical protein
VISEWISPGGDPGCAGKAGAAMPSETHAARRTTRGTASLASRALAVDRADSDPKASGDARGYSPTQDATEPGESYPAESPSFNLDPQQRAAHAGRATADRHWPISFGGPGPGGVYARSEARDWCRRGDLNPHAPKGALAPQASASAIPPLRRGPTSTMQTKRNIPATGAASLQEAGRANPAHQDAWPAYSPASFSTISTYQPAWL